MNEVIWEEKEPGMEPGGILMFRTEEEEAEQEWSMKCKER